jgi:hypothetical protein
LLVTAVGDMDERETEDLHLRTPFVAGPFPCCV